MSTTTGALQTTYPWPKRNLQTDFKQTDFTTRTKNRPIWLTIDGSKPTNDWWRTLHASFSQYHHGWTDQWRSTDQLYNIIDLQILFTWLWRWLPLRLSNVNHQQQFFSELPSPGRLHNTNLLILMDSSHLLKGLLFGFWGNFSRGTRRVDPSGQDSPILPAHGASHVDIESFEAN